MKQQSGELPQLTTTEELIVQYLDGELVRKELETVLFERLAQSAEARTLLREHLMMRGAIRSSMDNEMFQLSSDLDDRTRGRIEQMLQTIALDTPAGVIPVREFAPDAPAVASVATGRSLKRWALRPSLALLVLLLSVGTTWYVTRTATIQHNSIAANVPGAPSGSVDQHPALSSPSSQAELPSAPSATASTNTSREADDHSIANAGSSSEKLISDKSSAKPQVIIRYVNVPDKNTPDGTKELAQNSSSNAVSNSAAPAKQDDADAGSLMISHRYAKLLNATAKHEVVVTSRDRL